jgi:RNA polymerase sigma factor (sigma-70 family)
MARCEYLIMAPVSLQPAHSSVAGFPAVSRHEVTQLVGIASRFLGCDHLAHDAVQEALLSLSQQPEVVERPFGWLVRAVIHRSRHLRRSVRRRRFHEHRASVACELHADCENPLHVAIAHEIGGMLAAARDTLTREQRAALELFDDEGQDYSAIANTLNVPIGTVRSRLSRARETLRAMLKPFACDESVYPEIKPSPACVDNTGIRAPTPRGNRREASERLQKGTHG